MFTDPRHPPVGLVGHVGELHRVAGDEDRLLDFYEEVSGLHVERENLDFYRLIYALEMFLTSHNAAVPVVHGEDLSARLCILSVSSVQTTQTALARGIGILPPGSLHLTAQA